MRLPVASTSFNRFFPVPTILCMPAAGLSVADQSLSMIEVERTRRGPRLRRSALMELPPQTLEGGQVRDREAFVAALKTFVAKNKLDLVHAVIPEDTSYLFSVPFPLGQRSITREAIEARLEESVPLAPSAVVFDFEASPNSTDGAVVSAAPSAVLETYLSAFSEAGLLALSLETESSALARALSAGDVPLAIVDIGIVSTTVVIARGGLPRYASVVDIGSDSFIAAAQKYFNLSAAEAGSRIANAGFADAAVAEALIGTLSALRDGLGERLRFFQNQGGQVVGSIALVGRGASLPRLPDYLSQSLRLPVNLGAVWQKTFVVSDNPPPLSALAALRYVPAVGAALANLNPY